MPARRLNMRTSLVRPEGGHPSDRCRPPIRRPPTGGRLRVGKGRRVLPAMVAAFMLESLAGFARNAQAGPLPGFPPIAEAADVTKGPHCRLVILAAEHIFITFER